MDQKANNMQLDRNVNIVSLGNLITLVVILFSIAGGYYTLRTDTDYMQNEIRLIRAAVQESNRQRQDAIQALRVRHEALAEMFQQAQQRTIERTATLEAKVDALTRQQERVEGTLNLVLERLPFSPNNPER